MKRCYRCMSEMGNSLICPHCGYDLRHQQGIPYALPPGTMLLNKFLVGNVLGKGGFGITYIGFDTILKIKVAIKEYYVAEKATRTGIQSNQIYWTSNPGDMNHFITEAQRMAALDKMPEIAHVRDIFYANNTAYIVMEYVEGISLQRYLQNTGLMSYEQAVKLMLPVIDALGRVHDKGLVHRDISPDNLMMEPEGKLRVLDLGAAGDLSRNNAQATQMVARQGFSPYEQYLGSEKIGPYTDVYAVCATIYYCCTGKLIPDAMRRMEQYVRSRKADLKFDPVIPPNAVKVLRRGLVLEAKDRIPTMAILAEQLKKTVDIEPVVPAASNIGQGMKDKANVFGAQINRQQTNGNQPKKKVIPFELKTVLLTGTAVLAVIICIAVFSGKKIEPAESVSQSSEITADSMDSVRIARNAQIVPEETIEGTRLPLKIISSLNMTDVDYGTSQKVSVLSGHDPREIEWSSSDPAIAKISEDGTVTALGIGAVEITAEYGGEIARCSITVLLRANVTCTYKENDTGVTITGYEELPDFLVLPKEIDGKQVTRIGRKAFYECKTLTGVVIPEGVKHIGSEAFSGCSMLEDIMIPSSVTDIEEAAFAWTPWLHLQTDEFVICGDGVLVKYNGDAEILTIPEQVKAIAGGTFGGNTRLTYITIPNSVTVIGESVFKACGKLEYVSLSEKLEEIATGTFEDCISLKSVTIPDGVTSIGARAFKNCGNLTDIEIPDSVEFLGQDAFNNCSGITRIVIPGTVKDHGASVFEGCKSLSEVVIESGIDSIFMNLFRNCTELTTVTVPKTVERIWEGAFLGCGKLRVITISEDCDFLSGNIQTLGDPVDRSKVFPATCIIKHDYPKGNLLG